jgi:hypothetical protein
MFTNKEKDSRKSGYNHISVPKQTNQQYNSISTRCISAAKQDNKIVHFNNPGILKLTAPPKQLTVVTRIFSTILGRGTMKHLSGASSDTEAHGLNRTTVHLPF